MQISPGFRSLKRELFCCHHKKVALQQHIFAGKSYTKLTQTHYSYSKACHVTHNQFPMKTFVTIKIVSNQTIHNSNHASRFRHNKTYLTSNSNFSGYGKKSRQMIIFQNLDFPLVGEKQVFKHERILIIHHVIVVFQWKNSKF